MNLQIVSRRAVNAVFIEGGLHKNLNLTLSISEISLSSQFLSSPQATLRGDVRGGDGSALHNPKPNFFFVKVTLCFDTIRLQSTLTSGNPDRKGLLHGRLVGEGCQKKSWLVTLFDYLIKKYVASLTISSSQFSSPVF